MSDDLCLKWFSEAEWVSAMLTVGMCRAASVESFEGCLKELGQEDGPCRNVAFACISAY